MPEKTTKIRRPILIQKILKKIGVRRVEPESEYMSKDELLKVFFFVDEKHSNKKR